MAAKLSVKTNRRKLVLIIMSHWQVLLNNIPALAFAEATAKAGCTAVLLIQYSTPKFDHAIPKPAG
jgi:hypothetical protein